MGGQVYEQAIPVPFGDIDAAQVLYFPRIFHYAHLVMEGFFGGPGGIAYADLLTVRNLGFPAGRTEAVYHRPVRHGMTLRCAFTVRRIGSSSLDYRIRFRNGDDLLAEVLSTVICVRMDRFTSTPIPDDLRQILAAHLEPGR